MANIQQLIPVLLKWEGGYVNDPGDEGGPTNRGVTLATWKRQGYDKNGDGKIDVEDLKLISNEDVVERILRPHYWNRWQADRIRSQALANILVDWVWCSGRWGIVIPQGILGVPADGTVGENTLGRLNSYPDPEELFEKIKQVRRAWLNMICIDRPANKRFLKGWLNRLNDFRWIPVVALFCGMLSCRASKVEVREEGYRVKEERQTEVHTEKNSALVQNDSRLSDQTDSQTTEIMTAEFDTLDSQPVLKKLRIERTVSDRAIHADRQIESRITETGTQDERYRVKGEGQLEIHAEKKSKPVQRPLGWWLAGGIVAILGVIAAFRNLRKKIACL
jgi:lysozyme family protein